jgi:alpha-galactosidase/6-phospho-beta-glucosidase family protein
MDTEDEQIEKKYAPFIVNRCLSYFIDTVIHANEINKHSSLDKKMQFDYYREAIRKRKRFSKWQKKEITDKLETVKEYYGYSNTKATEIMDLLSEDEIEQMRVYLAGGGINP